MKASIAREDEAVERHNFLLTIGVLLIVMRLGVKGLVEAAQARDPMGLTESSWEESAHIQEQEAY